MAENSEYRSIVYQNLNEKETDELLAMWRANDRVEWTDVTFEVIEQILRERFEEVPEQGDPVLNHLDEETEEEDDEEDEEVDELYRVENSVLEDFLPRFVTRFLLNVNIPDNMSHYLEEENLPAFYHPLDVFRMERWLKYAPFLLIASYILSLPFSLSTSLKTIIDYYSGYGYFVFIIVMVVFVIGIILTLIIYYVAFAAGAKVLRILMQMEYNSRGLLPNTPSLSAVDKE